MSVKNSAKRQEGSGVDRRCLDGLNTLRIRLMPIGRHTALVAGCLLFAIWSGNSLAQPTATEAKYAYVVDMSTDTVLLEKASDVPMPPASLSKLMTVLVTFEALKQGIIRLEDKLPVSRKAWKKGGSKMFVLVNTQVSVADLLRGIIVQSGNDACIVIAEGLAGTEEIFSSQMTERGRELGLTNSTFMNSTGWPHPKHLMSARDLARIAKILIEDYPELYKLFGEREFTYNKISQRSRNPLLFMEGMGADGLKTGYTSRSGFGLTASAKRGERRILMVLAGLKTSQARSREARRLMNWAFRNYATYSFFEPNEEVTRASVWLGQKKTVPLVIPEGLKLTLSLKERKQTKMKVRLAEPVSVPISKGAQLGVLTVETPREGRLEIPLVAGEDVRRAGFFPRISAMIQQVLWGS